MNAMLGESGIFDELDEMGRATDGWRRETAYAYVVAVAGLWTLSRFAPTCGSGSGDIFFLLIRPLLLKFFEGSE